MDTFDQELALYESMFDSSVINAMNLFKIDCFKESTGLYTESVGSKIHEFVSKIKDAIVGFFKKCKDMITQKLNDAKMKRMISQITKAKIDKVKKFKVNSKYNEDLKKSTIKVLKTMGKYMKKVVNAKSLAELDKLEEELTYKDESVFDDLELQARISDGPRSNYKYMSMNEIMQSVKDNEDYNVIISMGESYLDEFEDMYDDIQDKLERKEAEKKVQESTEDDEENSSAVANKKMSIIRKAMTRVSSICKKAGSGIVKHKKGILAAILTTAVVFKTGEKRGSKIGYNTGFHKGAVTGYDAGKEIGYGGHVRPSDVGL